MGPKWSLGTLTMMRPLAAFARPARTARSVVKASSGRSSSLILEGSSRQREGRVRCGMHFPNVGGCFVPLFSTSSPCWESPLILLHSRPFPQKAHPASAPYASQHHHAPRQQPLPQSLPASHSSPHKWLVARWLLLALLGHADGQGERGVDARVGCKLGWEGRAAGGARLLARLVDQALEARQAEVVLAGGLRGG